MNGKMDWASLETKTGSIHEVMFGDAFLEVFGKEAYGRFKELVPGNSFKMTVTVELR